MPKSKNILSTKPFEFNSEVAETIHNAIVENQKSVDDTLQDLEEIIIGTRKGIDEIGLTLKFDAENYPDEYKEMYPTGIKATKKALTQMNDLNTLLIKAQQLAREMKSSIEIAFTNDQEKWENT